MKFGYIRSYLSLLICGSLLVFAGCGNEAVVNEDGVYGEPIKNQQSVDLNTVMNQLSEKDTVYTTVTAMVSEVCQKKGCWMTLQDNENGEEMMVRFKDYGFFVPKNIGGRKVMVEGKAFTQVVPVEELRHYAEDAGKSEEEISQITAPQKSFQFEATGVKLLEE